MLQNYPVTQAEHKSVENWPRVFDEHDVQFLVLDRHDDTDLLNLFRSQPGWIVDFEDEEAVIFARADIAFESRGRHRSSRAEDYQQ